MKINNQYKTSGSTEAVRALRLYREKEEKREIILAREHELDIYLNDILTMKLVCSPDELAELVLGRLLTEGVIDGICEVDYLYICDKGNRAKVFLNREITRQNGDYVELTPSCCTGNRKWNDFFEKDKTLKKIRPAAWKKEQVFALAREFSGDTRVHRATGGTHSCFLAREGKLLYCCEDIGRHNAMDKALGHALLDGVDLGRALLFTSGRVPVDMTVKAIRAGVPLLISKAVPTDRAVSLAGEYGLTLIGNAREESFTLYAGNPPEDMKADPLQDRETVLPETETLL